MKHYRQLLIVEVICHDIMVNVPLHICCVVMQMTIILDYLE